MKNEVELSKKSQEFLENLRVYLFSSGKKSDEMEEILDELEAHLSEAEKNGKSIEKIIGESPKEYVEMIAKEMDVDYREWTKYIVLIVFGSFSFKIFTDLMQGNLSYSILEIVGHLVVVTLFIAAVFTAFKYISTMGKSVVKQSLLYFGLALLPISSFVGLIYLNRIMDSPTIHFGSIGSLIIGVITTLFIVGISIWAKSWVLVVILVLLTVPEYVLSLGSLQYETQLIISTIITFGGIMIYLFISLKLEKPRNP
ncbi:HAAS domain-containing protein [Sporosarcina siberiensis]|uniref:HAAS domain-containing protein n=1 Tax=Sporosarcina siberiensis TaxID=1365606 RepID=A0ABW4SJ46_9BACL